MKAEDPDIGENGLVTYNIVDGDGIELFEITTDYETQDGVVKLKKDLLAPNTLTTWREAKIPKYTVWETLTSKKVSSFVPGDCEESLILATWKPVFC